jgi:hypothetical protein
MCGIFGGISTHYLDPSDLQVLANHAERRGKDSSGLVWKEINCDYQLLRADRPLNKITKDRLKKNLNFFAGHSRLITNGFFDNQPVIHNEIMAFHNGIILNESEIWDFLGYQPKLGIDSELLPHLVNYYLEKNTDLNTIPKLILEKCEGSISASIIIPSLGKMLLFSNTGSLYFGQKKESLFFASEIHFLNSINCRNIKQIKQNITIEVPKSSSNVKVKEIKVKRLNLIPAMAKSVQEEKLLHYSKMELRRCSKCILPETMPFIEYNSFGVCNYCINYRKINQAKSSIDFESFLKVKIKNNDRKCIFPFSGGRDSSFGLHLAVEELNLKPLTFTYDWGMVTDLARRNISNMCSKLGIENIIVAADISKKRSNIRKNLIAWLGAPNLGMLSMLTAGDKHFFKYSEILSKENNIPLNLWSINPLEVTHFKSGFLGVPPDFVETKVYRSGLIKQIDYQKLRLKSMVRSPKYFNTSILDTISGEYYRSKSKDSNYVHLFDYFKWDESTVESTLDHYSWERSPDSTSSWRIGDGTAAFYNYIYHRVAGFTEHDTFRSNQIREGDLSRDDAMKLIEFENVPRYENIKWYLDAINLDFLDVVSKINAIPRMHYSENLKKIKRDI